MRIGFTLTDYKIRSIKIFRGTVIAFSIIIFFILLGEFFYDLRSTTLEIMVPITIASFAIVFLSFKFPNSRSLRLGLSVIVYLMLEIHFLINPSIFHVITYWFPLIPLIALIIQGIRASQIWIMILIATHFFNSYFLGKTLGDTYQVTIQRGPFFITGIIFALGILSTSFLLYILLGDAYTKMKQKNTELAALKKDVEQKKDLIASYQKEIIALSRNDLVFNKGQEELFKIICKTATTTIGVNRVSIWLLENNNSCIVRKYLYEHDGATDDVFVLERKDYPRYFQAIENKPFVIASRALEHPETREFAEGYLIPLDILSMLDCSIIVDGKPVGVICCENQHGVRDWSPEDALFVQSLADFISASYKNERIKSLLKDIQDKNFELLEKNNEIETMNEELTSLNESLEETVLHRTQELETQNTQLTEYAFINSHLLRAPLSRILGLSYLLTKEATSIKDQELLNALMASTNEMDAIIRRISDILYDGTNLTREDIKAIIDRNLG